jgi:hypothetical protein
MVSLSRVAFAACLLCLAACQRTPDADAAAPSSPAAGAADAPAPPAPAPAPADAPPAAAASASGTSVDYACADGTTLQAGFGEHDATLRWPGGRSLTLPRAESASKGGGDVYVGETVSLQRDGARLQLHDGARTATTCDPSIAATRYACEGNATLIRGDDGSYRAQVPGNQPIRLTRIAGSTPPVYTGDSLYLRIGDDGAILSQGDRTNELHCTAG